MDNWPFNVARPNIREMTAYAARGAATQALHLDANENPWTPPPDGPIVENFNRYPAQQPDPLRNRLASLYHVSPDRIMVGRGADEAIDILLRTFCEPRQDSILICPPTFGYFSTAAQIQDVKILKAPLKRDFSWNISKIKTEIKQSSPKIVFLCSPNNPTGNSLKDEAIKSICTLSKNTLVVVDEAYIEFSSSKSAIALMDKHPNLIVLRTLSKAYSLAGVRVGACIADEDIISLMLRVLPPYPVPRPVEQVALKALSAASMPIIRQRINILIDERERLASALARSPYIQSLYPSDANFILMKIKDPTSLWMRLQTNNIHIRDFRSKIPNHFRLSIGSPEENDLALDAFGVLETSTKAERIGEVFRKTQETDIAVRVNLDNPATTSIRTGLGFFDHMLEQIAKHSGMGLTLMCDGDLEIDSHHSVEDTALTLGSAIKQALGDKAGIGRYGFIMPMDETQARIAIDISGRPAFTFKGVFPTDHVGDFASEMCPHFFQSLSQSLGASIQIDVEGENTHHMIEACFKGVGRALRPALARQGRDIPSTKGVL